MRSVRAMGCLTAMETVSVQILRPRGMTVRAVSIMHPAVTTLGSHVLNLIAREDGVNARCAAAVGR